MRGSAVGVACFDIGGSYIRYGRSDADGKVVEAGRVATPTLDFNDFIAAIEAALADIDHRDDLVSLSLAGVFDRSTGIAQVANVPCLHRRRVVDDLGRALSRPVLVTNDADCFALAEAHDGVGTGRGVVLGIILGTGVGGGVVINGQLLVGHGGIAGEWGHGPMMDPTVGGMASGIPHMVCGCGRTGCVDAVCSARGMEKLHHALHDEKLPSTFITRQWLAGDAKASRTIEIYAEQLARALSMTVNTLGADIVPVSGGLAAVPELIDRVDRRVRELALADYAEPLVVPGLHAEDGGLVGAAIAARLVAEAA